MMPSYTDSPHDIVVYLDQEACPQGVSIDGHALFMPADSGPVELEIDPKTGIMVARLPVFVRSFRTEVVEVVDD